jgi:hypothetical protein
VFTELIDLLVSYQSEYENLVDKFLESPRVRTQLKFSLPYTQALLRKQILQTQQKKTSDSQNKVPVFLKEYSNKQVTPINLDLKTKYGVQKRV